MSEKIITKNQIDINDFLYNMCRLENICVKRESMPVLIKRTTTDDITIDDMHKIDNLLRVIRYISSQNFSDFDLEKIKKINSIIENNLISESGQIRQKPIKITGTTWMAPIPEIDTITQELVRINNIKNTIDRAVSIMLYLMKYQLFLDGNKRTAQIVANCISQTDEITISIPFIHQKDFIHKLLLYYNNDKYQKDLIDFINDKCIFRFSFKENNQWI